MYAQGIGVSKNSLYAFMWFNIAALQDNERAKQFLERIGKNMNASQTEAGKKLSAQCIESNYQVCQ